MTIMPTVRAVPPEIFKAGLDRDMLPIGLLHAIPAELDLREAEAVAIRLKAEFGQLIETFPPAARKPSSMARWLGLQVPLCHRVISAARKPMRPNELLTIIPGPAGLEMFVGAAEKLGCAGPRLAAARAAAAEFEALIVRMGGSQRKLIEALSSSGRVDGGGVPSRRAVELREQSFRLAEEIYGSSADASVALRIYTPSRETADQLDVVGVIGRTRFERQHSGLPIVLSHTVSAPRAGESGLSRPSEGVLSEFCSSPPPRITTEMRETAMLDVIDPDFEVQGPIDFFGGPFIGRGVSMTSGGRRFLNAVEGCGVPSRTLVSDAYLPAAVASAMSCSAGAFRGGVHGPLSGDPAKRWFDRIPGAITPGLLGRGIGNAASDSYARQAELTARLFEHLGLDPHQFVGFRLEVAFPLMQIHYALCFESPVTGS